eukprot:229768-Rhodomonas_salina.6
MRLGEGLAASVEHGQGHVGNSGRRLRHNLSPGPCTGHIGTKVCKGRWVLPELLPAAAEVGAVSTSARTEGGRG